MSKEEKREIFRAISKMNEQAQVALAAGLAINLTMGDKEEPATKPEDESPGER